MAHAHTLSDLWNVHTQEAEVRAELNEASASKRPPKKSPTDAVRGSEAGPNPESEGMGGAAELLDMLAGNRTSAARGGPPLLAGCDRTLALEGNEPDAEHRDERRQAELAVRSRARERYRAPLFS